jgi:hypothetical protein
MESGIERALLDAQGVIGDPLDPAGDPVAVRRTPRQGLRMRRSRVPWSSPRSSLYMEAFPSLVQGMIEASEACQG